MSTAIDPWSLREIADAVGGEIVRGCDDECVCGLTTDSRSIPPRSLFVALRGERHDAHGFIPAVSGEGARAALVERVMPTRLDFGMIRVADTTSALGDLARAYRLRFKPRVAAVTGSSGKTTTKNFLAAICRRRFRTVATDGNLNNHIGVPLTLFRLDRRTEKAVIEMGMSDRGEIARLAEIAAPAVGVITAIGPCHLDRLLSIDGVIDAKAELIESLNASGGTVVLDADHPHCAALAARVRCKLVTVGESPDATVPIRGVEASGYEPASFVFRGVRVPLRLAGRQAVSNAALAAAAAELMGVDTLDIVEGLAGAFPFEGRSMVRRVEGIALVDDAYNANPLSYAAALETLRTAEAGRRIVVMADMLELGPESDRYHAELGVELDRAGVDVLVHRGEKAAVAAAASHVSRKIACATNEEMSASLEEIVRPGDVVLVKASHGMRLDEVVARVFESARRREHRDGAEVRSSRARQDAAFPRGGLVAIKR
jgi:UDP-N-acetylmuramoyl-tripeptide--D-alanyl-D-alanine ligase